MLIVGRARNDLLPQLMESESSRTSLISLVLCSCLLKQFESHRFAHQPIAFGVGMHVVRGQILADAHRVLWVLHDSLKVEHRIEPVGFPNPLVHGLARGLVGGGVLARVLDRQQRRPEDLDAFGVGSLDDLLVGA